MSVTPSLWRLPEAGLARALAAQLVLVVTAPRLGAGSVVVTGAAVLVLLLTTPHLPPAYAGLVGVAGWCCVTGFAVNDLGRLTFGAGDLQRLGLLGGLGLVIGLRARRTGPIPAPSTRPVAAMRQTGVPLRERADA